MRERSSHADVTKALRAGGSVFAEEEAELILAEARTPGELGAMVERRVAGFPLEHILGWAEFCGLRIEVGPGVFVPRHRTELLVQEAVRLAAPGAVVVDLCCGSGAVGAALAAARPQVELHAADVDPSAVECARRNLAAAGGRVYQGDLFEPLPATLRGRVDLLVANVPYVPTQDIDLMPREARLYESTVALDGGPDGLDLVRRVAVEGPAWLAPGGYLLVETSERQATSADEIFTMSGMIARVVASDELEATVVIGRTAQARANSRR